MEDQNQYRSDWYWYSAYGSTWVYRQGVFTPHQFVGKAGYYDDGDSGMLLLGHRYYLPGLQRFLTQDPKGHDAGLNLYEYAGDNPLSHTDPSALDAAVFQEAYNPNIVRIYIPIYFQTPNGYRPREVARVIHDVESAWTGQFGKYSVRTTVVDLGSPAAVNAAWGFIRNTLWNTVTIAPGSDRSEVRSTQFGEPIFGTWHSGDREFDWTVAHESGHLMGARDRYRDVPGGSRADPGWLGNIMANRGGRVDERTISEILNFRK